MEKFRGDKLFLILEFDILRNFGKFLRLPVYNNTLKKWLSKVYDIKAKKLTIKTVYKVTWKSTVKASGKKWCLCVIWYNISCVSIAGLISPFNTWKKQNQYFLTLWKCMILVIDIKDVLENHKLQLSIHILFHYLHDGSQKNSHSSGAIICFRNALFKRG